VKTWIESLPGASDFLESGLGVIIEAWLVLGMPKQRDRQHLKEWYKGYAEQQGTVNKERWQRVVHFIQQPPHHMPDDVTGYLFKKIEFLQRFVPEK